MADLEPQGVDQTAVADESNDPPAQIDDLGLGEMLAQPVEQFGRRLLVVARQHVRILYRSFLARGEFGAVLEIRDFSDQVFRQSLLPCQGKPGL